MRMLRWIILGSAVILVITSAKAQMYYPRYPVCLQVWQWGGSYYFDCSYTTWDQCRANAVGRAAMCLVNPYWPRAHKRLSEDGHPLQATP
jgi:hypothetical protein